MGSLRDGIKLDRSTLANWVVRARWWLTPLYELMLGRVLAAPKVSGRRHDVAGARPIASGDPSAKQSAAQSPKGRGQTKTGRLVVLRGR